MRLTDVSDLLLLQEVLRHDVHTVGQGLLELRLNFFLDPQCSSFRHLPSSYLRDYTEDARLNFSKTLPRPKTLPYRAQNSVYALRTVVLGLKSPEIKESFWRAWGYP